MFDSVGWGEILVLAVVGLLVIGPDRLPKVMGDLGRLIRQFRDMARGAASDLKAELGPEMADLDLRSLHPRRIVQDALFGEDDPSPAPDGAKVGAVSTLAPDERPPFDPDAT
ncbi:MAG TPA: sec-independent translocase [Mycobacteriales bacterium]|nr:sec-independent translocase [Mycobacteriales bacterium]